MFQLDLKSRKSIYEQIIDNIRELIVTGILKPADRLPSVRDLASTLTVNPNTIQKAYRELERQGYLYTVTGLGSFVSQPDARKLDEQKLKEITNRLRVDLRELYFMGLTREQIRELLVKVLEERGAENDTN